MTHKLKIGVLALARPTFDVPFAEEMASRAFGTLEQSGHAIIGSRHLLFDADATAQALQNLRDQTLDLVLILQVTFTDATMTVKIAEALAAPLAIWAFPEPRTGGRLRLNAFCGLNLAAHALGRAGKTFGWLYGAPDRDGIGQELAQIAAGKQIRMQAPPASVNVTAVDGERARAVLAKMQNKKIGLVGEHPAGFDTCRYDSEALKNLTGVSVQPITLANVFAKAAAVTREAVAETRAHTEKMIAGLETVDQPQLAKSFQLYGAFDALRAENDFSALAVRCWPEMFTEFGCAACGPMGLLNEQKTPCACEADVYGAVTALLMQEMAGAASYLVDVVDMDSDSNTGVVWHCGSAPLSMADPETPPIAQIHSNRKMPLLQEFALKPGRVTVARLSQARNEATLYIGGGEMLRAPKSFTGTSGVLRFDTPVKTVMQRMMDECLEHHVAIVYGDHRAPLRALGEKIGLRVKELG